MSYTCEPPTSESSPQWHGISVFIGVITVLIGYIISILGASVLSIPGFLSITAISVVYLYLITHIEVIIARTSRLMFFIFLTTVSLLAVYSVKTGIDLDWLMLMVSVSIFTFMWSLKKALLASSVLYIGVILAFIVVLGNQSSVLSASLQIGSGFIFVTGFTYIVTLYQEEQAKTSALLTQLRSAHDELRAYAKRVETLTEVQVRNEMAREIHDALGHYLTILSVQLETALRYEERGDSLLHEQLQESRRIAGECLQEVRGAVQTLRSKTPVNQSLTEIAATIIQSFASIHPEIEVVQDIEEDHRLEPELQHVLQRCLLEAFTNIHKHAHASKVLLRGRVNKTVVELSILDNGEGMQQQTEHTGFGLQGMQERIALYNGECTIGPSVAQGWRIDLSIPLTQIDLIRKYL